MTMMQIGVVKAQNTYKSSTFSYENMEYKKNRFAFDFGIGGAKGGGAFDLGVRYQRNFAPFFGWDVLSAKVCFPLEDTFDDNPDLQIMTGFRGTTPYFYKNMSGFVSIGAGYGFSTDSGIYDNEGGACLEVGVGVNLCKNVYIGYAFNLQKTKCTVRINKYEETIHAKGKLHYFRIGFIL